VDQAESTGNTSARQASGHMNVVADIDQQALNPTRQDLIGVLL
jgi:hypothetical protein